ncbi:class E sortase [Streptomyces kaniharaensis]|uniref:Class E sortase n=1 Tax=Streptomyces kaniharaensis TaxID=212423 RepID=A0A6N7KN03_9ACTN|nr:class E sortase [Streptomyces kaniharaensis]MQS12095.1 class E sortase [Streptomyces kaniharaensis]
MTAPAPTPDDGGAGPGAEAGAVPSAEPAEAVRGYRLDRRWIALCVVLCAATGGFLFPEGSVPAGSGSEPGPALVRQPVPVPSGKPSLPQPSASPAPSGTSRSPEPRPTPGQDIAAISIPHLEQLGHPYRFTVKEGVDKASILNTGAVGHYEDTQLPGEEGNFGLAAHRNTHGEPFRYINELRPGDTVLVETASASYQYVLDLELPQTGADNYSVLDPVPSQGGYNKPGRYITLTTCTPEFTSKYRLIWWGHLERVAKGTGGS